MTNTTNASHVPATALGIACARCSHWADGRKITVRHADRDAVRECTTAPYTATIDLAVEPVRHIRTGRFIAVCRVVGCRRRHEMTIPFTLKCRDHVGSGNPLVEADGIVRTVAQELVATVTKARCDSRCIHAVGAQCRCACGGVNHGVANRNVAAQPA